MVIPVAHKLRGGGRHEGTAARRGACGRARRRGGGGAAWTGAVIALVAVLQLAAGAAEDVFTRDARALAAGAHRLSGTEDYGRAAAHVEQRLRAIGVDDVVAQPFATAQTRVLACDVVVTPAAGAEPTRIALSPMRPNGIVPAVTGPDGITGLLYHAGRGRPADFAARPPRDQIVVLDYNAGDAWRRAVRLGARAVIFTRAGRAESWSQHHIRAPANFPRFYHDGPADDLPDGASATIHSAVAWEGREGRNVIGLVRGGQPVFDLERDELVVVAAHLDSFGDVPRLSPGARGAANCAALLHIAEHLVGHRPRRHVLLVFLDNQARGHAGAAALYGALDEDSGFAARQADLAEELDFLRQLRKLLATDDPVRSGHRLNFELTFRLKEKAAERALGLSEQLGILRRRRAAGRTSANVDELEAQIDSVATLKDRWNELRRALARGAFTDAVEPELNTSLDAIRGDVAVRAQELAITSAALQAEQRLREWKGAGLVVLHVSLLLGDASERWGLAVGGASRLRSGMDDPGLYGRVQTAFLGAQRRLEASGEPPDGFEVGSADGTLNPADVLWTAPRLIHSGAMAANQGIYNVVLCTVAESAPFEGTPDDTLEHLALSRIGRQVRAIAPLLGAVAGERALSQISAIETRKIYVQPTFVGTRAKGPMAVSSRRGGATSAPRPDAFIKLDRSPVSSGPAGHEPPFPPAYDDFHVVKTDRNGSYAGGPFYSRAPYAFGAAFDERGVVTLVTDLESEQQTETRLHLFRCRGGALVLPPQLTVGRNEPIVMDADTDSPLGAADSHHGTLDGVTWWYAAERVERVKLFGLGTTVALVNGPEQFAGTGSAEADGDSLGTGFPVDDTGVLGRAAARSAADLWRLNEARMNVLRARAVTNSSLEELHGRMEDLLAAATTETDVARADALAAAAFTGGRAVYKGVLGTMDDLVHAVLILLALAVPFSFSLERLLVGAVNIYRQIAWFALFFALTFLILFLSHPAFAIAKTPAIIFLAFAILVLSIMVIVIILRKFEVELKVLQGLTSTVHAADVSRFGTILAAVSMGISTMRRRPLRTALTAITIILLTFTILSFASFGTRTGIMQFFLKPLPSYAGVLLHRVNWQPLPDVMLDVFEGRWSDRGTVCPRYWVSPTSSRPRGVLLCREDGSAPLALSGVLGLTDVELAARADLRALLGAPESLAGAVYLTTEAAGRLGVAVGDRVLLGGAPLRVAHLVGAVDLAATVDLDDSPLLPVDFQDVSNAQLRRNAAADEQDIHQFEATQNWATLLPDSVAIVPEGVARRLGGRLHAIGVYLPDVETAQAVGEDVARMLQHPVSATLADGVHRLVLGAVVQASHAGDLLFPLLLGGLVVFGTMLGSVSDREREIYSFSALGLAPAHVAGLFFAEAMVYAVIGGLGGYLLAQGTVKILTQLASYGLVQVPEMNYSSANAIVTILVVMGTVLVSAIYPAVRASRSANPGILRTWRMPVPSGDRFDIVFPFTVSQYDFTGIVSFLKEHFDSYTDTGLGVFMARDARIARGDGGQLAIRADVALAPFDLGVTQAFELRSAASEIDGIDEIRIELVRRSGQPKDWQRLNKVLLNDLRRQFLIWRSLPRETMELYRRRTLTGVDASAAANV